MAKDVLRALLLDDDAGNDALTEVRFRVAFESLDVSVEWSFVHTTAAAWTALTQTHTRFDFIVTDLLWTRPDTPETLESLGLRWIAEARRRFPQAFVLALSHNHPQHPHIFNEALRNGAHRALRREELSFGGHESGLESLAAVIREHILDNSSSCPIPVLYDREDPNILDIVKQVGEVTLCRLYSRVLDALGCQAEQIHLGYIAPGASGACVCAMQADLAETGFAIHHLLKISKDRESLDREAEHAVDAARTLRTAMLVLPEPRHSVGPVAGWYALASPLQQNTVTVREWLAAGPRTGAVEDVFGALFKDVVGDLQRREPVQTDSTARLLDTEPFRQARIVRELRRLGPVLACRDGCRLSRQEAGRVVDEVRAFVLDGRLGSVERRLLVRQTPMVHAHRDFHGGNVLVYDGHRPQPVLVDLNDFGLDHWAVDPARLCVDLLLRGVDDGLESMLFGGFAAWRRLAQSIGAFERAEQSVNRRPGTRAALAALTWITRNLRQVCPAINSDESFAEHAWEWNLMLATHLLRGTCNPDITDPKRALALVAAYDQLRAAARGVPR